MGKVNSVRFSNASFGGNWCDSMDKMVSELCHHTSQEEECVSFFRKREWEK